MRRHVSGLESVLKLRRLREDIARQRYASICQQRSRQEQMLAALLGIRKQTADKIKQAVTEGDVSQLHVLGAHMRKLHEQIHEAAQKTQALRRAEENKRTELLQASLSRSVVERIYDRRLAEIKREAERTEALADDELSTLRHGSKSTQRPTGR